MNRKIQEAYLEKLDISYSYRLAKRMEEIRSNPLLGYRTAGSEAELKTGEMLAEEMRRLGFPKVWKDRIMVDAWEFKKAQIRFTDVDGKEVKAALGAYQTNFVTDGEKPYTVVYVGKGTEKDYQGLDVKGKIVLADINQRDEWWINYPVYQAYLKGAAALLAVQTGGYGEVDESTLNAQDIAGPPEAAAFSISGKDAGKLKKVLEKEKETQIFLDIDTRVERDRYTYNIIGEIPGRHPERKILLSAHYDSYFDGFQDDNTAISMMLGIGKALMESGYQPENSILFCAMAAEEWGVADSQFDWSTGAYEQVFTIHPEWRGSVIADLNFELPALAHGTRARIRSTYEYVHFLENFLEELPELTHAYPEETRITAPIETWSDDFSIAIAGIPSMVNDFTGGSFMETNYHSQFDNDSYYDEDVYRMHHELFGLLLMAIDKTAVVPLDFGKLLEKAAGKLDKEWCTRAGGDTEKFLEALKETGELAETVYRDIEQKNEKYSRYLEEGNVQAADEIFLAERDTEKRLLLAFQQEQDAFVRIDWYGNVLFPHEILQENLELLSGAAKNLQKGNLSAAFRKMYQVDNNAYAFLFEEEVHRHFTDYVLHQPPERLKWGNGRIVGHENLFDIVKSLLNKRENRIEDCQAETELLLEAVERQKALLKTEIDKMTERVLSIQELLRGCLS